MTMRKVVTSLLAVGSVVALAAGYAGRAGAQKAAAAPAGAAAGAGGAAGGGAPSSCKAFGAGKCCDPMVTAHLPKDAVFKACGESDATYLGEAGSKESCKYHFKVEGEKPEDTYVEVYAPAQKEVPSSPQEPFFAYKKVGKVFVTEKAKTPKMQPALASSTGLWLPGKGYAVSVNAKTKVCTKAEATKLAPSMK
jgi:hypothetical protein